MVKEIQGNIAMLTIIMKERKYNRTVIHVLTLNPDAIEYSKIKKHWAEFLLLSEIQIIETDIVRTYFF